jgi:hypothetical protein
MRSRTFRPKEIEGEIFFRLARPKLSALWWSGDRIDGSIEGVGSIVMHTGPAEQFQE